jgi:energy-coupling factor transporter ATP-binding protein EcfA2
MINQTAYPGSRWWKFDFHTHTPASLDTPWASLIGTPDELTPEAWLLKYMEAGIDCVGVTDHNSGAWIDRLKAAYVTMAAQKPTGFRELHLFPGVEFSVNGGIHLLALFDKTATTAEIDSLLGRVDYDGTKGDSDGVTRKSLVESVDAIVGAGGIPIPAHVDQAKGALRCKPGEPRKCELDANTVLQLLGHPHVMAMEVVAMSFSPPAIYDDAKTRWASVLGTDCHNFRPPYPQVPGSRFTWVKMGMPSLDALKLALHDGDDFSILRSDKTVPGFDPNQEPEEWLESLEVMNARWMGRGHSTRFAFSPWMNAVIGGRGSGKSTLVHFIRLASRREDQLGRLGGGNRVQRTLQNFKKVGIRSSDEGALLPETQAVVIYRKGGHRYRLTWLQQDGGTTVESYDPANNAWTPASSQDVTNRFPLALFSQDEIGMMAENPSALLQRVDEAIGKADWDSKWEQGLSVFLGNLAQIRSLRSRLAEKERLKGELEDIIKKLVVLENSAHAAVFKKTRSVRRQHSQMESLFEAYDQIVTEIREQQEHLVLHDLQADLIDPDRPEDAVLAQVDQKLRAVVAKAAQTIAELATSLEETETSQKVMLAASEWEQNRQRVETEYKELMAELEAKGIEDPSKLTQLTTRRQALEKNLKEIEGVEKNIEFLRDEASRNQDMLLALRRELQTKRADFLENELKDNRYVRIELRAFGSDQDKDRIEGELRRELGCEDTRFADAIRNPERETGLIETIYQEVDGGEEDRIKAVLRSLAEWKVKVTQAAKGQPHDLPGAFQNFLKREFERRPEYFDRFYAWWPEDSLEVSYSKGGAGRDFVSLKNGSAGEKAAALLAFFLAQGEIPLIIDQPENDLDNHLITDLVVNQLRENKKRRQIIVVTHNPNIVVNGDAEMVHAMRFASGQCTATASGSLQNGIVRTEVCEVMEGGRPALKSRYQRLI